MSITTVHTTVIKIKVFIWLLDILADSGFQSKTAVPTRHNRKRGHNMVWQKCLHQWTKQMVQQPISFGSPFSQPKYNCFLEPLPSHTWPEIKLFKYFVHFIHKFIFNWCRYHHQLVVSWFIRDYKYLTGQSRGYTNQSFWIPKIISFMVPNISICFNNGR